MSEDFLKRLDAERRKAGQPSPRGDVVRSLSPTGAECVIVYSHCAAEDLDEAIRAEIALAEAHRYALEWKVYGHDTPPTLKDRLLAAGFEPGPMESLMVIPVNPETLAAFGAPAYDIRRIHDAEGLEDIAAISREIGRKNVEVEQSRLARTLEETPGEMSVYVAYHEGEPVACARVYFTENSEFAEMCGGRTKTAYRNRGLYTALVAARLREALERHRRYLFVDALPTSEPILRKRGFQLVTQTQPFVYQPG